LEERHFVDATGRVVEIATDHYRTDQMRQYLRLTRADLPGAARASRSETRWPGQSLVRPGAR
jgi:hypothetical protein